MKRWFWVFTWMSVIFLVFCIPFTSYWLVKRWSRSWRRYKKDKRRMAKRRAAYEKALALKKERDAQKAEEEAANNDGREYQI